VIKQIHNLTAKKYVRDVWSKYPQKKQLELENYLEKSGNTFKAIIEKKTDMIVNYWQNLKEFLLQNK
jgi:hypothetical protein